jgi:hypothetical protein
MNLKPMRKSRLVVCIMDVNKGALEAAATSFVSCRDPREVQVQEALVQVLEALVQVQEAKRIKNPN